jgi:hypothetical protein
MTSIFVVAAVISIIFLVAKFLEMRYIEKESKPLKFLIRDTLLVYFSVIIANFVLDQVNPFVGSGGGSSSKVTPVFTDNPGF